VIQILATSTKRYTRQHLFRHFTNRLTGV